MSHPKDRVPTSLEMNLSFARDRAERLAELAANLRQKLRATRAERDGLRAELAHAQDANDGVITWANEVADALARLYDSHELGWRVVAEYAKAHGAVPGVAPDCEAAVLVDQLMTAWPHAMLPTEPTGEETIEGEAERLRALLTPTEPAPVAEPTPEPAQVRPTVRPPKRTTAH